MTLAENERQAVRLADELRTRIDRWLAQRGIRGSVIISPFVGSDGRPNVLIRTDAHVAHALLMSLDERPHPPPSAPPPRRI
ncbi:hypothetical protein BJF79_08575 [Actinomadura sp. CNU-125]|uniref:hypothetical protein n=1 Tax=Actinomadura sp. CNU-125 TaxID=1904961 RepID=UPI0009652D69|nr:hypothetical protein [Actinomadura sp. CNU-125]OLT31839.1 hypothetical protein BJF79_08575 [Actinomadura sp. CNU-125]